MKTIKTSFRQMLEAVPADIQHEVDMEIAISNRISELMAERGLSKLEFAQALGPLIGSAGTILSVIR